MTSAKKSSSNPIWDYFKPLSCDLAKCVACEKLIKKRGGGVSALTAHLESAHPDKESLEYAERATKAREEEARRVKADINREVGNTEEAAKGVDPVVHQAQNGLR